MNGLKEQGWNVIVIHECELKKGVVDTASKNLIKKITS